MDDGMHKKPKQSLDGAMLPEAIAPRGAGAKRQPDPIAVGLQQLFATVAEEPVPDEFMALLDRIDANERLRHPESNNVAAPITSDGETGK